MLQASRWSWKRWVSQHSIDLADWAWVVLARVDVVGWLIRRWYKAGSIGVGRGVGNDIADDEEYTLLSSCRGSVDFI